MNDDEIGVNLACGCNKKSNNRKELIARGKKTSKKNLPLITVRKQVVSKKLKKDKYKGGIKL